jgi:hypothetical protein
MFSRTIPRTRCNRVPLCDGAASVQQTELSPTSLASKKLMPVHGSRRGGEIGSKLYSVCTRYRRVGDYWSCQSGRNSCSESLEPVSVIVFPGGFNWPIWVAQDKGYFASGGIEVNLTNTPNSVFQLTNLIEGKFDIAMTAIDNVIAYMGGKARRRPRLNPI